MKTPNTKRLIVAAMAGILVCTAVGCSSATSHKENVAAAHTRVNKFRSDMMIPMITDNLEAGDLDEAQRSLMEAIQSDPKNPRLYVLLGRVELERGRLERSMHRFDLAIELDNKISGAHYYKGIVQQRWHRYEQAQWSYNRAFELNRDNIDYLLANVEMHVANNKTDEALKLLLKHENYFESSAGLRSAIGQVYTLKGDFKSASRYFRDSLLINSSDTKTKEDYSLVLFKSGQYKQVITTINELNTTAGYRTRSDIQYALGDSYEKIGDLQNANDVYLKIVNSSESNAQAWLRLGEISWLRNDVPSTIVAARNVIKLEPKRYDGYFLAGMAAMQSGDLVESAKLFDECAMLNDEITAPLLLSGIVLEKQGLKLEAKKRFKTAVDRDPEDKRANELYASISDDED